MLILIQFLHVQVESFVLGEGEEEVVVASLNNQFLLSATAAAAAAAAAGPTPGGGDLILEGCEAGGIDQEHLRHHLLH